MEQVVADPDDNRLSGLEAAPEFLVEGYRGVVVRGGIAKLNFFSQSFDPSTRVVAKRAALVMAIPVQDLTEVVDALQRLVRDLRRQGLVGASGAERDGGTFE